MWFELVELALGVVSCRHICLWITTQASIHPTEASFYDNSPGAHQVFRSLICIQLLATIG
ncbi:hypothetical protein K443DRAFT_677035 [Laccaria amethystina LaAM-08-1]|uniref:Uncharacterized protein n=1 Tax=Laccaria amethystina LaAM-08-1 TaxID=1095629 RepID=A0A0C9Y539_9AGAR|nr:hypothetical protein K443DRAFT_684649 [Laccaria amethystina LaAM-08-1]KIK03198.1 hypothetical protein K443DRAFT_677035 [Laccaria amethystina LaAM-08-1]